MTRALAATSFRAVARSALLAPAGSAALLALATAAWLDVGLAVQVLRGVALLLAAALVTAVDDPTGEVLAASPHPLSVRTGTRLAVALGVVVPVWVLAAAVASARAPGVPVAALTLEAAGVAALAVALATGLQRWRGRLQPSAVAAPGVFVAVLALNAVPRGWALLTAQTWGPPWTATHLRWAAVLAAALAVVRLAVRDPLDR